MDPLNVPYFHFRWVLKLLTSLQEYLRKNYEGHQACCKAAGTQVSMEIQVGQYLHLIASMIDRQMDG